MHKRQIRSFAGAFVSYSLANDTESVVEILKNFVDEKQQFDFLLIISVILSRMSNYFDKHPHHTSDQLENFVEKLLRQGEINF